MTQDAKVGPQHPEALRKEAMALFSAVFLDHNREARASSKKPPPALCR